MTICPINFTKFTDPIISINTFRFIFAHMNFAGIWFTMRINNFRSTSDLIEHSVNNRIKPYRYACVWFLVTVTLKGYTNLIFQSDDVLIIPIGNPFRTVSSPQSGPVFFTHVTFLTRDGDCTGLQTGIKMTCVPNMLRNIILLIHFSASSMILKFLQLRPI